MRRPSASVAVGEIDCGALRAIVFYRSFFCSLLFAALIVQIVSSDLVIEIF
jgi:hypothetical protein